MRQCWWSVAITPVNHGQGLLRIGRRHQQPRPARNRRPERHELDAAQAERYHRLHPRHAAAGLGSSARGHARTSTDFVSRGGSAFVLGASRGATGRAGTAGGDGDRKFRTGSAALRKIAADAAQRHPNCRAAKSAATASSRLRLRPNLTCHASTSLTRRHQQHPSRSDRSRRIYCSTLQSATFRGL